MVWRPEDMGTGGDAVNDRRLASGYQRQTMMPPCRNRYHAAQSAGHARLSIAIVTPRDHRSVLPERQTVNLSCRNRCHADQPAGHNRLTVGSASPRDHGSILLERQTMEPSCSNS